MKAENNHFAVMKLQIEKYISKTSAEATLKGFLYQFFLAIDKWLKFHIGDEDYKIYLEEDDDINIEVKDKIYYIQAKAYDSTNFTLNEPTFVKSIYHFYMLYCKYNSEKLVQFILDTNSKPGLRSNELSDWAKNTLKQQDKKNIYKIMNKNLEGSIDNTNHFTDEQKNSLKQGLYSDWYEFIDLIKLNFKYKDVDESINDFKISILNNMQNLNNKTNKNIILNRLLVEVFKRSIKKDKEKKELDRNLLNSILRGGEENNIMAIEETLNEIKNEIDNLNNKMDNIDNRLSEVYGMLNDSGKYVEDKKEILGNITIRSREKVENSLEKLSLSEFFIEDRNEPKNNYRQIKDESYWNNELLHKIDMFFINLAEIYSRNITIDLDKTHTSIAFYIGYTHLKRFSDTMYYIKNNDIYYEKQCENIDKFWTKDEEEIDSGENISVIVTSTMEPNYIKDFVKKFIEKDSLCTSKLLTFYLRNKNEEACNNCSINKENIEDLKNKLGKLILKESSGKKINLFLSCPNEFAYLLGRTLDKYDNIVLYEVKNYGSSSCDYVRTIDIKERKNKYKLMN